MSAENQDGGDAALEAAAARMFELLARSFPVCSSSDEFHFFPQAVVPDHDWSRWDDFSPDGLDDFFAKLGKIERDIRVLGDNTAGPEVKTDAAVLARIAQTLRGQFYEAGFHRTHPTHYLSVASIGLAEAIESGGPRAFDLRASALPSFLETARNNLQEVPRVFLELGMEMAADIRVWLGSLDPALSAGLPRAREAVRSFEDHLKRARVCEDFCLPPEVYQAVVKDHIGCGAGIDEVEAAIDEEIRDMLAAMEEEAESLGGRSWREALDAVEPPLLPEDGLLGLYRDEVERAGRHCVEHGLASEEDFRRHPVTVAPTPSYLSAIRSAAAYSFPPGHPPSGGVFFIMDADAPPELRKTLHRDCRMLTAHETWPGHHLLDLKRWGLDAPRRRPIEFPLFYEGWACFGEDLMMMTGAFALPSDRLRLARRHYWRAVRGKVDLGIQTGRLSLSEAAGLLAGAGMDRRRAQAVATRYALKPGYQLCYTLGLRGFRSLFRRLGRDDPAGFTARVLSCGEMVFKELAEALERSGA